MSEILHNNLRVLMPALHYPPVIGGIERWTKEIAERLSCQADIFVATGKVRGQQKNERRNGLRINRSSLFRLNNLSRSPWWYTLHLLPFCYFRSVKIIKREKINLIHCNGFLSGYLGYRLKKRFNIPYIITIQSLQQSKPLQRCKRRVYSQADTCIAVSQAVANYLAVIGVNRQRIAVVPNGIDISRFSGINKEKARQEFGLNRDGFAVITVGRLDKRKGIQYLLKAVNRLQSIPNLQLLIVGDGEERKSLEGLTKQLGLQNRIRFLGEIANKDIPGYLAAADCFCLPSIEEGFGIVILEAMAAGLPVVAAKVGGIQDLIENGQTGVLIEPKNPRAIAQAIERISLQPDFALHLIENARTALPRYDWQNITKQVFQIYGKHIKF